MCAALSAAGSPAAAAASPPGPAAGHSPAGTGCSRGCSWSICGGQRGLLVRKGQTAAVGAGERVEEAGEELRENPDRGGAMSTCWWGGGARAGTPENTAWGSGVTSW